MVAFLKILNPALLYYLHLFSGLPVDLSTVLDPHTVAGLLKMHLRELRFSLIPQGEPTKKLVLGARNNDVSNESETSPKLIL